MGWLFSSSWPTKSDLIRHLIAPHTWTVDGVTNRSVTVKHACVGANLWTVREQWRDDRLEWRTIVLYLTGRQAGYGWGYKDICESMGAVEVNCPLSYLDGLTDPPNEWAAEWRGRVREYHAERRRRVEYAKALAPGALVTIYGKGYAVVEVLPRGQLRVRNRENGLTYLARARQLTPAGGG